jgi:putative FmdB family regulatory protein
MPIYEYRCPGCGTEFERLVDSRTAVVCPTCASATVTRRLSLFRPVTQSGVAGPAPGGGACCGGGGCGCH